jgi:hypothetical protein
MSAPPPVCNWCALAQQEGETSKVSFANMDVVAAVEDFNFDAAIYWRAGRVVVRTKVCARCDRAQTVRHCVYNLPNGPPYGRGDQHCRYVS